MSKEELIKKIVTLFSEEPIEQHIKYKEQKEKAEKILDRYINKQIQDFGLNNEDTILFED